MDEPLLPDILKSPSTIVLQLPEELNTYILFLTNGNVHYPLHNAARHGQIDIINLLIYCRPDCINNIDDKCRTPLIWAAAYGHIDCVKFLVENGAHLELYDSNKHTALLAACVEDKQIVAEYLISVSFCSMALI